MGVLKTLLLVVLLGIPAVFTQPPGGDCFNKLKYLSQFDAILGDRVLVKGQLVNDDATLDEWMTTLTTHISDSDIFGCGHTTSWVSEVWQGLEAQYDEHINGNHQIYGTGGPGSGYEEHYGLDLNTLFTDNRGSPDTIIYKFQQRGLFTHQWVIEQLPDSGGYRLHQGLLGSYSYDAWVTIQGGSTPEQVASDLFDEGLITISAEQRASVEDSINGMALACNGCDLWGDPHTYIETVVNTLIALGSIPAYLAPYTTELANYIDLMRDYSDQQAIDNFANAYGSFGGGQIMDELDFFTTGFLAKLVTASASWQALSATQNIWTASDQQDFHDLFGGLVLTAGVGLPFSTIADLGGSSTSTLLLEVKVINLGSDISVINANCAANANIIYQASQLPCEWADFILDTYLGGYACNEDGVLQQTLVEAQDKCCECRECGGVTYDPAKSLYSPRIGPELGSSKRGERSWVRNPAGTRDCGYESPMSDSFLQDYACGDGSSTELPNAQERCCLCDECTGVVCEGLLCTIRMGSHAIISKNSEVTHRKSSAVSDAQPTCDFNAVAADTFLTDYTQCDNGKVYLSVEAAESACCDCVECSGVTCAPNGACTLRAGAFLKPSRNNEQTYQKTPDAGGGLSCDFDTVVADTFLADYTQCDDGQDYLNVEAAESACCDCAECTGVTCTSDGTCTLRAGTSLRRSRNSEQTYRKTPDAGACTWGTELENSYLGGRACADTTRYLNLDDAQKACCDCVECAGVTTNQDGTSSIRIGPQVVASLSAESTYLKQ